ncbi:hypothetical protein BDQ17DRAFT_1398107 [Cyathus striatus]|nr:hypothetical protein BDQ17DRAFT_1398107 [Cyathus striatus]
MEGSKFALPAFLKIFTSNNISVPKALEITGKMQVYKECNTPAKLAELTEGKLVTAGIENKEDRKLVLNAIRKSGYVFKCKSSKMKASETNAPSGVSALPSPVVQQATTLSRKKRKRTASKGDLNEFLPNGPRDEAEFDGSFEFSEIIDEDMLRTKSTIVNRAPLMTVWSMLVAQRLNFRREEALSIASVYTEINAVSKGISLGMFNKSTERGTEASKQGSQPYVELLGRRPLYRSLDGQWRALSNGSPIPPNTAFSYITRSLGPSTPYLVGALKLLADSYKPGELNAKGWSLYAEFRPSVDGWGEKSEVNCDTILNLRKVINQARLEAELEEAPLVKEDKTEQTEVMDDSEPNNKKSRTMTLEEYEAALDEDTTFDNVNLDVGKMNP